MKKVLFYIVFAAVTFVVTLALLSQRLEDTYMIERDIAITAPMDEVSTEINERFSWKGTRSGSGKMIITEASVPNAFVYNLQLDGWAHAPTGEFHLIHMVDSVRVVWTIRGTRSFKDKIVWSLFGLNEDIKADLDESLDLLKNKLEKK